MQGAFVIPNGHGQGKVSSSARVLSGDLNRALHGQSSALLTTKDVAAYCQVSYWTARDWIDTGKLKALRLGRLVRVRPADLEAFLGRCAG